MNENINRTVLMSGVEYFDDSAAINPFMVGDGQIDASLAAKEHRTILAAFEEAGIQVIKVAAPNSCQDGVYTANWALVRGNKAVLARLPNARQAEEPYAAKVLRELGKEVIELPKELRFSGQGDALPCGNYLFCGSQYRSDVAAQTFAAQVLGYEPIQLQTIPLTDNLGQPVVNAYSGWADSFFYDIDLALSVLKQPSRGGKGLIAWCPEAFSEKSQYTLRSLNNIDKIEVSLQEAKTAFACNLVSTGSMVIMSDRAPDFCTQLESRGFKTITPKITELSKGGGYIRCTSLTLD